MNTAHPEVAVLLHGEDEWLAELVSRSECVGQRACSSNLSDGASSATTGRRSIHDPEVALLLRGEENWLAELVSRSEPSLVQVSSASDDNQDVEKKSVPASSISQKLGEKLIVSTNGARVRDVEVPVVFSHMSCQKIRKLLESLYYIVLAGGKPVHRMGELVGTSKIFPRTE